MKPDHHTAMKTFLAKNKTILVLLFLISILFFVLRLPNLTLQPIFADEAIYIRWAQIMKAEPTLRFLPLSDGKTPLFMWALIPLFKLFSDPLFAGRLLSVLSGFLTLLGLCFLGWKFFSPKVGIWAAFLAAITPFLLFFDRMALVDSMLAAFSVWSLNLALLLINRPKFDLAMFLGYVLGAGMLTKTPGYFSLITLPVSFALFDWSVPDRQKRFIKTAFYFGISILMAVFMYNLLRLGPNFESLSSRNQDYVFPVTRLIEYPLDPFLPHLRDLLDWFPKFLTWPILGLTIMGVIWSFMKKNKYALVILFWSALPLFTEIALLKTFTARYILFPFVPLIVLAAWVISDSITLIKFPKVWLSLVFVLLLLPLSLNFNLKLLTDPANAPLPKEERRGYLEDWTAGYGFPEIASFLMNEAQKGTVVVGTEGSFGTLPDGLMIYLDKYSHTSPDDQRVVVIGGKPQISDAVRDAATRGKTFFVANKSRVSSPPKNTKLIKSYHKAEGEDFQDEILLFQVFP